VILALATLVLVLVPQLLGQLVLAATKIDNENALLFSHFQKKTTSR
jgi:hypothetical protein